MSLLLCKARTALALGLPNLFRALVYRVGVRTGLNPVRNLRSTSPKGQFFRPPVAQAPDTLTANFPNLSQGLLFSYRPVEWGDAPPDWHANPFSGARVEAADRPWWQIPDFDPVVGDIKLIWELSRFDWALCFARAAASGNELALHRLNAWLLDWCERNPPYFGPNWKCGQEASIRVMHLAAVAMVLKQVESAEAALLALVRLHLQRIEPTIMYAVAQDNNHGTSEAAALFIGGSWLALHGDAQGEHWGKLGRRWLENRAARLIGEQGSFSQYSVNYHRVMLDSFSLAEVWRRQLGLKQFSQKFQGRAAAAANWLFQMCSPLDGDVPNLGANDGARLLPLAELPYRDFRPSIQLGMALFAGLRAYPQEGVWNDVLHWFGILVPDKEAVLAERFIADDGGFAVMRHEAAVVVFRYPRFRFRPSQADALHVDFWLHGRNVLRDAGTFSYNTAPELIAYFGGTAGHNTVQFDNRDQMPRLSRFLFGDWLKTLSLDECTLPEGAGFAVAYRDVKACFHRRSLVLSSGSFRVKDEISGFAKSAVLRWRLMPGNWRFEASAQGGCVFAEAFGLRIVIHADVALIRCQLLTGLESRNYLEKTELPVLEVEVAEPGILETEVFWTT